MKQLETLIGNDRTPTTVGGLSGHGAISFPAVPLFQRKIGTQQEGRLQKMPAELPILSQPSHAALTDGGMPVEGSPHFHAYEAQRKEPDVTVRHPVVPFTLGQASFNHTGLPDQLKSGMERMSGFSMDDVKVRNNSGKPAQMQALAYAQGTDIHIGPGQERHLPHEAWHIVQQKQGKVRPTMQMKQDYELNDDEALEQEATSMGRIAMDYQPSSGEKISKLQPFSLPNPPVQRMLVGMEMETKIPIYPKGEREDHVDGLVKQAEYSHTNVDETLRAPLGGGFEIHVDSGRPMHSGLARLMAPEPLEKASIMEIVSRPVASRKALLLKLQIAKNFLAVLGSKREYAGAKYCIGWPIPKASYVIANPRLSDNSEKIEDGSDGEKANESVRGREETFEVPQDRMEELFNLDHENTKKSYLYQVDAQFTFQFSPDNNLSLDNKGEAQETGLAALNNRTLFSYDEELSVSDLKNKGRKKKSPVTKPVEHKLVDRKSMAHAMDYLGNFDDEKIIRVVDVAVKIFKDTIELFTSTKSGTVKNKLSYLIRSDLGKYIGSSPEEAPVLAGEVNERIRRLRVEELDIPKDLLKKLYDDSTKSIKINSAVFDNYLASPVDKEDSAPFFKGEQNDHVNKDLVESLAVRTKRQDRFIGWEWEDAMSWLAGQVRDAVLQKNVTGPLHGLRNLGTLSEGDQESSDELEKAKEVSENWWSKSNGEGQHQSQEGEKKQRNVPSASPAVVVEDRQGEHINISTDALPSAVIVRLDEMNFPK